MTRLLTDTHADGHEEDPALAVTMSYETFSLQEIPVFTFNGPDGEVEIIGAQAAREVADAIYRVLGAQVARAA